MINIVVYWWGDKYPQYYVDRLRAGITRNLTLRHRFIVISDRPREIEHILIPEADLYYTRMKGCFARLRLFDPVFQRLHNLHGLIVSVDLDLIVTGSIDHLFQYKQESTAPDFSILQGVNGSNPCPYNGSLWSFKAGTRPDVWSEFSPSAYHHYKVPFYAFPDDQGWFSYKIPKAGYYGSTTGVYAYMKRGWSPDKSLPDNACMVAFPGFRDPIMFEHIDWVTEHWR